jgi:UDP-N-acetylmuramyl pentapeptide phosphotransferase/UDP-N-acetylglucosamine-1-phosphate transferase
MNLLSGSLSQGRVAFVLVGLAAALLCAVLIVLLRPLLQRYALARPNARSSHVVPTPQGAGIAVIGAVLATVFTSAGMMDFAAPLVLFGATAFIGLVGFVDDVRPIPVLPRLLLQAAAVAVVLLAAPNELRIFPNLPLILERGLLWVAGLWFLNLVNFMDGLDLMTVAEIVPITAAIILMGWFEQLSALPTLVAAALCGAMIGFAPFNRPVAKVFLGDVGSLPIGLLAGWCLLQLAWHGQLTAALLLPLYYLADATLTLLRRISRGEQFWAAHRSHFYQRATDNGFTVSQVVSRVFAVNVALAALAVASINVDRAGLQALFLLIGAVLVTLVLCSFATRKSRPSRGAKPPTEFSGSR